MTAAKLSIVRTKKPKGGKALLDWYLHRSEVFLTAQLCPARNIPRFIYVEFRGKLARLPSLKNSRIPGTFFNPDTHAKLHAMTILAQREIQRLGLVLSFGDVPVSAMLICGQRNTDFDTDNCLASIKDWLEPASKEVGGKKKRERGWGIGVVPDDKQITGYALHSEQTVIAHEYSVLIVKPFDDVRESIINLVVQHQLL